MRRVRRDAVAQELEEGVGVHVGHDLCVGGVPGDVPEVGDGAAVAGAAAQVDLDVHGLHGEQVGAQQVRGGQRVVQRAAVPAVAFQVVFGEECEQVRDERAGGGAQVAEHGHAGGVRDGLVGGVQADHGQRHAAPEDDVRGVRVGQGVEFGGGRPVAGVGTAAHPHDLPHQWNDVRCEAEGQRDVRQGSGGDQRDLAGVGADGADDERGGVLVFRAARGDRQVGAVQAALAVHGLRADPLLHQRAVRSGVHRHVGAGNLAGDQGVAGGAVQAHVPEHGGQAQDVQFRAGQRQEDVHGVVVAGVEVQDDGAGCAHAGQYAPPGGAAEDRPWVSGLNGVPCG
ncbi:hypothetical protein GCM10008019_00860 [Deinococcus soli (ex Cha et al. 2016)]|nr:hypothetical protein GCM10008019_00860 [Deinococcus soli (ex Cha et al. 2016)]